MKSFGGAFAIALIGWLIYVIISPEPCIRVQRVAAPVRIAFDGTRWLGQNWLSVDSRLTLLLWQVNADKWTQDIARQTLYGAQVRCDAVEPAKSQ